MRGNGGGGTIDRLVIVEWIGVLFGEVAELVGIERAAVPIRHAVLGGVAIDVEIAGGLGGFEEEVGHRFAPTNGLEFAIIDGVEELKLLGIATDDPGRTARPSAEGGVALLGARATELAVVAVEDGFVGDATADVVDIATLAEEYVVARGGRGVRDGAVQEINGFVALAHQHMAELMRD